MSKGKSLAVCIAIVVVIALLGVVSMTGFPINSTSYVMPLYKAIQTGEDTAGGIAAVYQAKVEEGAAKPDIADLEKASAVFKKRLNINGFTSAQVLRQGDDSLRVEYPELNTVNHDPYTEMLAQTSLLKCYDPAGALVFDGRQIDHVKPTSNPDGSGSPGIQFQLNGEGTKALKAAAEANVDGIFQIFLDDEAIAAIRMQDPITNGLGFFVPTDMNESEVLQLAVLLESGPLPFAMERVGYSFVGGVIAENATLNGLLAFLIVLFAALLALIVLYRKNGIAALLAAAFYSFLFVLALATVQSVRLSVASLLGVAAGMILALACLVAILERAHQDLFEGKAVDSAISSAFGRVFGGLFDIHIAVAALGVLLFFFGSAYLKDFSITLLIGLAFDVFVLLPSLYGVQRLMANIDARPESYTRMGKVPPHTLETVSGKKKNKKRA